MKPFPLILAIALALATPQALAQTYYWDTSTNSGIQNGNGTWGTDNFWASTTAGTNNVAWINNATAWLGGNSTVAASPSGNFTITVSGTQITAGIRQIQNGAGNFTLEGGELQGNSFRADTNTLTINSVIGSYTNVANARVDFNAQPAAGTLLILGGDNTLTNNIGIAGAAGGGGTVRLNHQNALGLGNSVTWTHSTVLDLNGYSISGKNITVGNSRTASLLNSGASNVVWSGNVLLTNTTAANFRAGGTNGEVEISGVISGASGNQVQSFDGGRLRLSGANTYDGTSVVRDNSTLIVGNASALGSTVSGTFISTGATLDLNGFNVGNEAITLQQTTSKLVNSNTTTAATVGGGVTISTTTGEIGGPGSLTVAGVISGTLTNSGFTKVGSGTLTLGGVNSYGGTTTVSAGSLIINGNQSAATGVLNVLTNATLGGSGTIGGATTISGIHSPGNSAGVQTFNSGLTYATDSTFVWELFGNTAGGRSTSFDGVDVTGGTLTINTGVTSSLVFNGSGSTVQWSDSFWDSNQTWLVFDNASAPSILGIPSITIGVDSMGNSFAVELAGSNFEWKLQGSDIYLNYVVPEPSTYALLLLAAIGLGAHVVRRRRSA